MKPMTIILVGALIAILGGVIGAIGTWKHNKSSSAKSNRIEEGVNKGVTIGQMTNNEVTQLKKQNADLITQSFGLTEKIENQSKTIDNLRQENAELYSKLANSSLDIYNNLTGGNSYCTLTIGNIDQSKTIGSPIFMLGDKDKSPLRNLQVRIVDLNTFSTAKMTLEDLTKNLINIEILEPRKSLLTPHKFQLDKKQGVNLNVFFSANNGFFIQLIRMRYVSDTWSSATIVERDGKTIFEKIDKNYPEQNKNKIFNPK